MKKQYVVFGAGRFGRSIAVTLQSRGCEVIVVDRDPEVIEDIADEVSYAICANVEDPDIFADLGMKNLDGAIVAITESLEASIVTTMMCHEMGIPRIMAKARKVGATRVMYPEVEMGRRVAKYIVADNFADWIELSPKYSLVEMAIPSAWIGRSIRTLGIREKYHLNVVGIKNGDEMRVKIDPEAPLLKEEVLIVVGEDADLQQFQN